MLNELKNLSTDSLMELLSRETSRLTALLAEKKFDIEYKKCKESIKQIQVIIDLRKEVATTTPNPVFQPAKELPTENKNYPDNINLEFTNPNGNK